MDDFEARKSGVSGKTAGLNETTGSFHYKTGWIASTNVKVRSVDDYHKNVEPDDDVFDNNTPESKQHAMMSSWVLFRKKLNNELIRKLLDPRRVGRCEPTRVYTIDQGTSKFAIFNAKRDRSLQHARALYLHPDTYVSMGIPRVRSSLVREKVRRLSQNSIGDQVDGTKENAGVTLRRQISVADSDYYSARDEFGILFRGEMTKGSAVQTFRPRSKSMVSNNSKQDETKRSTESIQLAVDFT
ncbi:uncharacterized protein LOC135486613 isoform X2 [Lineus longissimus]|uniref:uncharacterized protein LOC135486613 isoform X2 n=1 Tax=Lineus longissimus TaxID=88925 RepID=UPI002B4F3119